MKFYFKFIFITLVLMSHINVSNCFFDAMCEGISNMKELFKDLGRSLDIKSIAQSLSKLKNFIDSTVEEDCIYECSGNRIKIPRPNHVPNFNGCGSLGMYLEKENLPHPQIEECCNKHDICYDTCGSDKEICDKKFKRCTYDLCNKSKICKAAAKLLYTSTIALGCSPFKDAQSNACLCQPVNYSNSKSRQEL